MTAPPSYVDISQFASEEPDDRKKPKYVDISNFLPEEYRLTIGRGIEAVTPGPGKGGFVVSPVPGRAGRITANDVAASAANMDWMDDNPIAAILSDAQRNVIIREPRSLIEARSREDLIEVRRQELMARQPGMNPNARIFARNLQLNTLRDMVAAGDRDGVLREIREGNVQLSDDEADFVFRIPRELTRIGEPLGRIVSQGPEVEFREGPSGALDEPVVIGPRVLRSGEQPPIVNRFAYSAISAAYSATKLLMTDPVRFAAKTGELGYQFASGLFDLFIGTPIGYAHAIAVGTEVLNYPTKTLAALSDALGILPEEAENFLREVDFRQKIQDNYGLVSDEQMKSIRNNILVLGSAGLLGSISRAATISALRMTPLGQAAADVAALGRKVFIPGIGGYYDDAGRWIAEVGGGPGIALPLGVNASEYQAAMRLYNGIVGVGTTAGATLPFAALAASEAPPGQKLGTLLSSYALLNAVFMPISFFGSMLRSVKLTARGEPVTEVFNEYEYGTFYARMLHGRSEPIVREQPRLLTAGRRAAPKEIARMRGDRPTAIESEVPIAVQRIEELGDAPSTVTKPQGLYTSPADIVSPHIDLGGVRRVYYTNPNAQVLTVDSSELIYSPSRYRMGPVGQPANIAALTKLVGVDEVNRLLQLSRSDALSEAKRLGVTGVDRYTDTHDIVDAIGGHIARERGFDAIWAVDKKGQDFNEYVGLTDKAFTREPLPSRISDADAAMIAEATSRFGEQFAERVNEVLETRGTARGTQEVVAKVAREMVKQPTPITEVQPQKGIEAPIVSPPDNLTPEAEFIAETGGLPTHDQTNDLRILMEEAGRRDVNLVNTILQAFSKLDNNNSVAHLVGLDNPGAAAASAKQLMPEGSVIAVHRATDGTFEVAVGGPDSPLKGSETQFAEQGYYEGQPVYHNGTMYEYKTRHGDLALVRVPGVKPKDGSGLVKVKLNELRKAPWTIQKPQASKSEIDALAELRNVVDEADWKVFRQAFAELHPAVESELEAMETDLEDAAASNNMKAFRIRPGAWVLLDNETMLAVSPRIFGSEDEALDFLNKNGQATGPEFIGPTAGGTGNVPPDDLITALGGSIPPEGDGSVSAMQRPLIYPRIGPFASLLGGLQQFFAQVMPFYTEAKSRYMAFDNKFGTDLTVRVFQPVQMKFPLLQNTIFEWYEKARPLDAFYKTLSEKRKVILGDALEAQSYQEMITEGIIEGRLPTEREKAQARSMARLLRPVNSNFTRIYSYIRALHDEFDSLVVQGIYENVSQIPPEVGGKIRQELNAKHKMLPEELKVVDKFEFIRYQSPDELSLDHVVALAEAQMTDAPSKAEFIKKNNITKQELAWIDNIMDMYNKLADFFEIPDHNRYRFYLSHARKYGIGNDPETAWLGQNPSKSARPARKFAADYIRSGEVDAIERDPFKNLITYMRNGIFDRIFAEDYNNALEYLNETLKKQNLTDRNLWYHSLHAMLLDLRGNRGMVDTMIQDFIDGWANKRGVKGVDIHKDIVTPIQALVSSAALGLRVGLAARDFYDITNVLSAHFGYQGAAEAMADGWHAIDDLKQRGWIAQFHWAELAGSTERAEVAKRKLSRMAEFGLKYGGQPLVHEWAQASAAIYILKHFPEMLNLVRNNAMTKEEAFEKLSLYRLGDPIAKEIDRLLIEGREAQAVDIAAFHIAIDVAGRYGMGNSPWGWRSAFGRVFSHFGNWSVFRRSSVLRGLSTGTRKNRLEFLARLIANQAFLKMAGKTFGLNMNRWYMAPGWFFLGGPGVQYAQTIFAAFGGEGSDRQERAHDMLKRMVPWWNGKGTLLFPYAFFINDIIQASVKFPRNKPGFQRAFRAVGIPIAKRGRPYITEGALIPELTKDDLRIVPIIQ